MGFRTLFCFQIFTIEIEKYRFKQKMKIEFLEKNSIFDKKIRFSGIFEVSQLKLRNSSFQQNGLFRHQNSLRNS